MSPNLAGGVEVWSDGSDGQLGWLPQEQRAFGTHLELRLAH